MADIRFYHLTRKTAEQALPDLVRAAYNRGHKVLVRGSDDSEVSRLNDFLWVHHPDSFLPHGTAKDGHADKQPIFLTSGNDNPAGADVLMLMPGAATDDVANFSMCCQLLNGHDEAQIAGARELWKTWKAAGHAITYWQQSEQGKWEQKA